MVLNMIPPRGPSGFSEKEYIFSLQINGTVLFMTLKSFAQYLKESGLTLWPIGTVPWIVIYAGGILDPFILFSTITLFCHHFSVSQLEINHRVFIIIILGIPENLLSESSHSVA